FFFQAEDGIRDRNVTGVQTCALPICLPYDAATCASALAALGGVQYVLPGRSATISLVSTSGVPRQVTLIGEEAPANWLVRGVLRSEERRVGKEGRCRWW